MNTLKICKTCHKPLPQDAPEGICPECALQAGFGSQPFAGGTRIPPTPAELAPLFPQLEIIELLGQGGMGIVYKARQKQLDRVVALKILPLEAGRDSSFAERFSREARALASLNHPNIVSIYDSGETQGLYYFVMEFVDGANLRQALHAGQIQPRQALAIVPAICDALQFAHDAGLVHRDIKPENVLMDRNGRVKIADFGLAKLLKPAVGDPTLTMAGSFMGTPRYMAPEQIEHPDEVDHRADIYSLGVVFYEMLTGEVPQGRYALPSQKVQVDVRLDEVVLRTLQHEPARRYQQVSEVKSEVESIIGFFDRLPPALQHRLSFEYRSTRTLFGWPLLHVAYGINPRTGKNYTARGIFAFGGKAIGVVAFGGVAMGVLPFGGLVLGLFPVGGLGLGLVSFCGLALGVVAAYGGVAVAPFAFGGVAIGYYAMGGIGMGVQVNTREMSTFARRWGLFQAGIYLYGAWFVLMLTSFLVPLWARRQKQHQTEQMITKP